MKSTVMKSTHKELHQTNRNVLEPSKVLYSSEVLVQSYAITTDGYVPLKVPKEHPTVHNNVEQCSSKALSLL